MHEHSGRTTNSDRGRGLPAVALEIFPDRGPGAAGARHRGHRRPAVGHRGRGSAHRLGGAAERHRGLAEHPARSRRSRVRLVAALRRRRHRGRGGAARLAAVGRRVPHGDSHRVPRPRRRAVDLLCARSSPRDERPLELHARERPGGPRAGRHDLRRPARHCGLGHRPARRHQPCVWWIRPSSPWRCAPARTPSPPVCWPRPRSLRSC